MAEILMNPPEGTGTRPQMPTEPTAEAKAMDFKIDPSVFDSAGDSTITIDGKEIKEEKPIVGEVEKKVAPVVEAKKVDAKVEPKKEAKSVLKAPEEEKKVEEKLQPKVAEQVAGVKKEVIKPITPVKEVATKGEDKFDYAKYAPQEVTNMKNMSAQSREAYAKAYRCRIRTLSSLKDATYLQHGAKGILCHLRYQQMTTKAQMAQIEGRAWEQALLDIKAGKPFKQPVEWDSKSGKLIDTVKRDSTF